MFLIIAFCVQNLICTFYNGALAFQPSTSGETPSMDGEARPQSNQIPIMETNQKVHLSANYQTYSNQTYGIEISHPTDWRIEESTDFNASEIVRFIPPGEENSFVYKVYLSIDSYGIAHDSSSISEELKTAISFYSNNSDFQNEFKIESQALDTNTLDEYPAYTLIFSFNLDGKEHKVMELGIKVGETVISIMYNAEAGRFDKYLPDIQKMMESFKLI